MRGKANACLLRACISGITPAYAGKRLTQCLESWLRWDHPRLCGEKDKKIGGKKYRVGSPPPMRGKVVHSQFRVVVFRITPAYAGKSFEFVARILMNRDHPRLCGEKLSWFGSIEGDKGSPPPMRGKVRSK